MNTHLYETHLHTYPVSRCAKASVRQTLEFYRSLGYSGVFITNHFNGSINCDPSMPYEKRIEFYFSDYEEGVAIGKELGIDVFCGVEYGCPGAHFLVYGLDKAWFLAHPEVDTLRAGGVLKLMREAGGLIVQAHPYRDTGFISLFPQYIDGAEEYNADDGTFENQLAEQFVRAYDLIPFAGSDNHTAEQVKELAGVQTERPVRDEKDFVAMAKNGKLTLFRRRNDLTVQTD